VIYAHLGALHSLFAWMLRSVDRQEGPGSLHRKVIVMIRPITPLPLPVTFKRYGFVQIV
jgi:hypothetical protein